VNGLIEMSPIAFGVGFQMSRWLNDGRYQCISETRARLLRSAGGVSPKRCQPVHKKPHTLLEQVFPNFHDILGVALSGRSAAPGMGSGLVAVVSEQELQAMQVFQAFGWRPPSS
jgi:hypothetical protein